jgi:hypothetical protein
MLKIGITGHRGILNVNEVRKEIAYWFKHFKKFDKDLVAITAIASGADTVFAEEAIKQNIPLQIELPFPAEEYKKDFSNNDLIVLERLLNSFPYNEGPALKTTTKEERKNAYLAIGQKVVDLSDIVIAVWDGKDARGTGGTAEIIDYAKTKNKQVHIIKAKR